MEDHLSWFDKHIIQRTKSYKDFVREMENTSPEQFYKDGERVFTDKEKKFLQIYNFKNGIKEFPIVSVKEVPVIPIKNVETTNREPERVETGMRENVKSDRGICADESDKQEIIGKLYFYDYNGKVGEVMNYSSVKSYLNALESQLDSNMGGFRYETILRDPKLLKDIDDLIYGAYGDENPNSLNSYIEMVNREKSIEQLGEQLEKHFDTDESYGVDFKSPSIIEILKFVIDLQNIDQKLKEAVVSYLFLGVEVPHHPERYEYTDDSYDRGQSYYEKAVEKYEVDSEKHDASLNEARSILKEFNYDIKNIPPSIDSTFDLMFVGDLQRIISEKFSKEIVQMNINHQTSDITDKEFIIEDLKITQEQRKSLSNFFEFGEDDGKYHLTEEQKSKIPDVIEKLELSPMGKIILAIDFLSLDNEGVSYQITDDNRLLKTSLNENLEETTKYLTNNEIKFNNQNPNIMETQKEFDQVQYLKDQLKYLGFGEAEKLHKDLEKGIKSVKQQFEIKTSSDKSLPGNQVDFTLKFNKSEAGGVFLNAYNATLKNEKGEEISHNFPVNRENNFTAKEAVNLLEGRAVKIEFQNPKTEQLEPAFVKFNFEEPKTEKGNYQFQNFYKNYGVDTTSIVEKSNLIFDKPEYKENTIKSLEKGNVVKVKFELDDKVIEGKAVLNPQYKNLNLYDQDMSRINTNKPLEGIENDSKQEKNNAKEQSIKR